MARRMGENIALEWAREKFSNELQFALNQIEQDREKSLRSLYDLSGRGSSLAMTYLGGIYLYGKYSVKKNVDRGIKFLHEAFDSGSIEGGYLLAYAMLSQGNYDNSIYIYDLLSKKNYAPAQFKLGKMHYLGQFISQNKCLGIKYITLAANNEHFFAKIWLYDIEYFAKGSFLRKSIGIFLKLVFTIRKLPEFILFHKSDKFRL